MWSCYQGECLKITLQLTEENGDPRDISLLEFSLDVRPFDGTAVALEATTRDDDEAELVFIVPSNATRLFPLGKRTRVFLVETDPEQCGPKSIELGTIDVKAK